MGKIHGQSKVRNVADSNMSIEEMRDLGLLNDKKPRITDTALLLEGINPLESELEETVGWTCSDCDEPNLKEDERCTNCGKHRCCD